MRQPPLGKGERVWVGDTQSRGTIDEVRGGQYDVRLDRPATRGAGLVTVGRADIEPISEAGMVHRIAERYDLIYPNAPEAFHAVATAEYMDNRRRRETDADLPDGVVPTVDDDLDALVLLRDVRAQLDADERRLIICARTRGATWGEVGHALGTYGAGAKSRGERRLELLGGDDPDMWPIEAGAPDD